MAAPTGLNVWLFSAEYPPTHQGGQGIHTLELATGLGHLGCQVTVLAFTPHHTAVSAAGKVTAHLVAPTAVTLNGKHKSDSEQMMAFNQELLAYCQTLLRETGQQVDIIHCQDWILFPAAQALGQQLNIPVIGSVHLLDEPFQRWWGDTPPAGSLEREREFCRQVDALITVSQSMAAMIEATHGRTPETTHVVYNGVDSSLFAQTISPEAKAKLRRTITPGGAKMVMFAGRLSPVKGLSAFFAAGEQVVHKYPQLLYVIVGEPASRAAAEMMEGLSRDYAHLKANVKRLGRVPRKQLALLYQVADLAVVPSIYESFGYSAAEAMAAGVPVVASNTGGLAEIIEDGRTGRLVSVAATESGLRQVDVGELAAAQLALLADEALARQLGRAGQEHILQNFTLDKMIRCTLAVYQQAIEQKSHERHFAAG